MAAATPNLRNLALPVAAMCAVVVASNILVQYPVGQLGLADYLTWGAFTYPVAFFITDLTNRRFGVAMARRVVVAGFVCAVALSIYLATPRIALASGSAFLCAQLLDVTMFDRLRRNSWWQAPLLSSVVGSALDTLLFFSLAFAAMFSFIEPSDAFAVERTALFGGLLADTPRWVAWALSDFAVKMAMGLALLVPYGALRRIVAPMTAAATGPNPA